MKYNHTGQKFGRLTALKPSAGHRAGTLYWDCRCDCGKEKSIDGQSLRDGRTKSCGCLKAEETSKRFFRHGHKRFPEYSSWSSMVTRCTHAGTIVYRRYGAVGVTVCERWVNSFENFYADMGPRPSKLHSIDRIDNDKGYSKENCRWATATEQAQNRKCVAFVEFRGLVVRIHEAYELSEKVVSLDTFKTRVYKYGWPAEDAATISVGAAISHGRALKRRVSP